MILMKTNISCETTLHCYSISRCLMPVSLLFLIMIRSQTQCIVNKMAEIASIFKMMDIRDYISH